MSSKHFQQTVLDRHLGKLLRFLQKHLYGNEWVLVLKHPQDDLATILSCCDREQRMVLLREGIFMIERAEAMAEAKNAGPAQ